MVLRALFSSNGSFYLVPNTIAVTVRAQKHGIVGVRRLLGHTDAIDDFTASD